MGFSQLAKAVTIIVFAAASIGQLPRLIHTIQKAQAQLIQESKASRWGRLPLLPVTK